MPNLVGIGNTQVPTNATLGALAYQDFVGAINLDKIKAKTSDTAVDVFVYDTRKDSDGGAWRHRTQHLSWYNEGASALRGARKEFPAVAVLVLQSLKLTIYDGDDPNLPMWMVLTGANNNYAIETQALCTTALNGIICIGCGSNGHDFYYVNFLQDAAFEMSTGAHNKFVDNIATRSSHTRQASGSSAVIISRKINDVSMTVLPNAPTDVITGLQVPTIAIATDSGISVITNDGTTEGTTVYDLTTNNETSSVAEIAFLADNRYSFATKADNSRWWVDDIQTADENHNYFYQRTTYDYGQGSQPNLNPLGRVNGTCRGEYGEAIFRQASGMSRIRYIDRSVNYTTTDYNTGWMPSNIEGAYLSSTDTTDLVASNLDLITNGTFDSDSGWTKDGSWTISGGTATNSGGGNINQTISVVSGKRYLMTATMDFTGDTSLGNTTIGFRTAANDNYYSYANTATFTANSVNYLQVYWTSTVTGNVLARCYSGDGVSIDNWSVQVQDSGNADRSVNNKGLQVYGTISATAVATGSELVAYHGINGGNYLRQPYNSDLNFSTNDFSIIVWVKKNTFSTNHYIIDRATTAPSWGGSSGRAYFIINASGYHRYKLAGGSEQTGNQAAMPTGVFTQIGFVRRSGVMEFWMNGVLVQTITGGNASASFDASITNQTMTVNRYANGFAYDYTFDRMALLRISASAPSATQMKKIYDDEKCLFHENAKCTLYGTSDAVTAAAYDDSNDVLHAGTSSGRSEFQGLNRINNTTTAVTHEISASNGFVAEQ